MQSAIGITQPYARWQRLTGVVMLALLCLTAGCQANAPHEETAPPQAAVQPPQTQKTYTPAPRLDPDRLQTGDLLFRRGRSIESWAVLLTDRRTRFSHVGLVDVVEGVPYVMHLLPGKSDIEKAYIVVEPVRDFLGHGLATEATVYRLKPAYIHAYAGEAVAAGRSFRDAGVTFDDDFDLGSSDRMYCTEFIWRAYQQAGLDLVDSTFEHRTLARGKSPYILPGTLTHSLYLDAVYAIAFE